MSAITSPGWRTAAAGLAPVAFFAALLSHPHIGGRLPNDAAVAAAVVADPVRWGLVHLAAGAAFGILVLAFLAVRAHLRAKGEEPWSAVAIPFVVVGSTLYTILPGMEFAPLAAARAGHDVQAAQAALGPWFVPLLLTAAATFAVGAVAFAVGVLRSGVLSPGLARIVAAALVVMAAARFVPFAAVQFHVQGAAAVAAFWPLAYALWTASSPAAAGPGRRQAEGAEPAYGS
jgi:hypothetical protein